MPPNLTSQIPFQKSRGVSRFGITVGAPLNACRRQAAHVQLPFRAGRPLFPCASAKSGSDRVQPNPKRGRRGQRPGRTDEHQQALAFLFLIRGRGPLHRQRDGRRQNLPDWSGRRVSRTARCGEPDGQGRAPSSPGRPDRLRDEGFGSRTTRRSRKEAPRPDS